MSSNFNPNTIAKLANLSKEQIAETLNTRYTATDIDKQQKALEQLKEQLCNPKQVTIVGWVAVDEYGMDGCFLHTQEPHAESREFCDTGEYEIGWYSDGVKYELDNKLFPDLTPETEPKKYRITITPIE